MLVLTRRVSEAIVINQEVTVQVVAITPDKVRIGIVAPAGVPVLRKEFAEASHEHVKDPAPAARDESLDAARSSAPTPRPQAKPSTQPFDRSSHQPRGAAGSAPRPVEPLDPDALIRDLFDDDLARQRAARALASLFGQSPAVKALVALLQALRTEQNLSLRPLLVEAIEALGGKIFLAEVPDTSEDAPSTQEGHPQGGHLPSPAAEPIPPRLLQELSAVRGEVADFHRSSLRRLQKLLNGLAGKQAQSDVLNKELSKKVNELARRLDGQLLSGDQPAYLRWHKGVFEAQTTNSARELLTSSAGFPRLTVRPKVAVTVDEVQGSPERPGQGRGS